MSKIARRRRYVCRRGDRFSPDNDFPKTLEMQSLLLFLAGISPLVIAAPTITNYEIHEKREFTNPAWVPSQIKLDQRASFPISIGLTQQNIEHGHDFLMDVSDPKSSNYAKGWTAEKVIFPVRRVSKD